MPTYDYFCEKCNKEFEADHKISEKLEECPTCKEKPKKLIGKTNFILQGDGWARDNYK